MLKKYVCMEGHIFERMKESACLVYRVTVNSGGGGRNSSSCRLQLKQYKGLDEYD